MTQESDGLVLSGSTSQDPASASVPIESSLPLPSTTVPPLQLSGIGSTASGAQQLQGEDGPAGAEGTRLRAGQSSPNAAPVTPRRKSRGVRRVSKSRGSSPFLSGASTPVSGTPRSARARARRDLKSSLTEDLESVIDQADGDDSVRRAQDFYSPARAAGSMYSPAASTTVVYYNMGDSQPVTPRAGENRDRELADAKQQLRVSAETNARLVQECRAAQERWEQSQARTLHAQRAVDAQSSAHS